MVVTIIIKDDNWNQIKNID